VRQTHSIRSQLCHHQGQGQSTEERYHRTFRAQASFLSIVCVSIVVLTPAPNNFSRRVGRNSGGDSSKRKRPSFGSVIWTRQIWNGGSSTDLWTLIGRWSVPSVHACTYPRLRFISQVDESEKTMYKSQLKAVVPDADEKEQYFKVSALIIAFRSTTILMGMS